MGNSLFILDVIKMKTIELITYLNDFLSCKEINDSSKNGLQIEGPDTITKVAFAVDSCQASFKQAVIAAIDNPMEAKAAENVLKNVLQGVE